MGQAGRPTRGIWKEAQSDLWLTDSVKAGRPTWGIWKEAQSDFLD